MPTYIDITYPINSDLPFWPGSVVFASKWNQQIPFADANVSSFTMDAHFGTHLDAPLHFVEGGKPIQELSLDKLIGPAYVVEIKGTNVITSVHLERAKIPEDCKRLLLKTDNQQYWQQGQTSFQVDFCALDVSAAQWVVDCGIELIGIDYLSIQRFSDGPEVHQVLLRAEVIIVETLNLERVEPGSYDLICLPINVQGLEAAPIRAVLRKPIA